MLLQLASIGILIALIPLCYVLVKGDRNKYRKLVWITAFLTLDLIMFGSFTRLTDSGPVATARPTPSTRGTTFTPRKRPCRVARSRG